MPQDSLGLPRELFWRVHGARSLSQEPHSLNTAHSQSEDRKTPQAPLQKERSKRERGAAAIQSIKTLVHCIPACALFNRAEARGPPQLKVLAQTREYLLR